MRVAPDKVQRQGASSRRLYRPRRRGRFGSSMAATSTGVGC